MKTERRHELQTNTLADSLGHAVEAVRPYQQIILGCILAVIVVFGVARYLSMRSSADQAAAWDDYLGAINTDDLEAVSDVVENHPDTPAAYWANIFLGDRHLEQGTNQLFVSKADAKDELKKAEEAYQAVIGKASEPLALQRATLGLARTYESMVELDKARQQYQAVLDKWPGSNYAGIAERRLKDLNEPSTKQFYDWFADFQPRSGVIDGPGTPGMHPPFNLDNAPGTGLLDDPSAPSNTPATGGTNDGTEEVPARPANESEAPAAP
jgi:predicted negative regulator of RcsB-dependent stress response